MSTQTSVEVSRLVSRIANRPTDQLGPSMDLGTDLGLDSIGLVELLAVVEAELGVFLDEGRVSGSTSIAELEALVAQGGTARGKSDQPKWPTGRLARLGRLIAHILIVVPLLRLLATRKVEGREHLDNLLGPALFVSNHLSHVDAPAIYASLPSRWRRRMAAAAATSVLQEKGRIQTFAATFFLNAFPFSQTGAVRSSIGWCGRLLDSGWSIRFFPEGTRSRTGSLWPFKRGAGMLAVEMAVPVVPVHVKGTLEILARHRTLPRRGHVRVRFGEPLRFSPGTTYLEAAGAIEEAVKALEAGE